MIVKSLNNFINSKPHDTHGFKEKVKIKFDSVKAIAKTFPNGKAVMMILLAAETVPIDWDIYCVLPPDSQRVTPQVHTLDIVSFSLKIMYIKVSYINYCIGL